VSACFDSKKYLYVLPSIDFVKIEFKTLDSELIDKKHYPNLIKNTLECLKAAIEAKKTTYIKIVVSSKTELSSFNELRDQFLKLFPKKTFLGLLFNQQLISLNQL